MSQQQSQNNQMEYGKRGLFVSFEGNDGSGKTTQIQRLTAWLQSHGREVLLLREPGGTRIGEKIREMLLDKAHHEMAAVTEMLLYAASRAQLVHTVIRPAVEAGAIVICDRFVDQAMLIRDSAATGASDGSKCQRAVHRGPDAASHVFSGFGSDLSMARRQAPVWNGRLENEPMAFHRRAYEGYWKCARTSRNGLRVPVMDGDTRARRGFGCANP
jgi:dTMP kinase